MYRVMIVDDEEPVLDSFTFILEKDVEDFSLCGKARSGIEAINLIAELKPDLVFMDIQMPGMDGIETITQIRKVFPNIVFILATAYERFDIAQKAIPLGVFSYLVKPVSKKILLSELAKVKKHLDKIREDSSLIMNDVQFVNKTRQDEQNRFLSNIIWKNPSDAEWESFSTLFSVKSDKGVVYIAKIRDDLAYNLKNRVYLKFTRQIQYKHICFSLQIAGQVVMLFPEDKDLKYLDGNLDALQNEFSQYGLDIAAGELCHYSEFAASYLKAEQKLKRLLEHQQKQSVNEADKVKEICKSVLLPDWPERQLIFEEYWIDTFNTKDFQVAKGKMVALFTLIINELDSHSISTGNLAINPSEEIMVLESIDEWRAWAQAAMQRLQTFIGQSRDLSYPKPLVLALDYIHNNYNKPLQLSEVADKCRVSSSYLSRLFSDHLETSFIEYLNRYKLNFALTLLKDENMSIKEVSFLVGYQDPNYFSRIFKKYMHISPSDLISRRIHGD